MGVTEANGIELYHESFGSPGDPAIVLIAGLGSHSISWDDGFCAELVDHGFHVTRFDNRDVGLSTHLSTDAAYVLSDMAADTFGLMDALGIERAHLAGRSMGGMIAQTMAIEHPDRVLTLTSMISNTGESEHGQPRPETLDVLLHMADPVADEAEALARAVELARVLGGPATFDEAYATRLAERCAQRNPDPDATRRQMMAVVASGSRADGLRAMRVPTLVIHGDVDPLVDVSGGRRTAELVAGARYHEIAGMGHELPPVVWSDVAALMAEFIADAVGA
jgi:pimeloyl-ACP methyl ester carboxylesterase